MKSFVFILLLKDHNGLYQNRSLDKGPFLIYLFEITNDVCRIQSKKTNLLSLTSISPKPHLSSKSWGNGIMGLKGMQSKNRPPKQKCPQKGI